MDHFTQEHEGKVGSITTAEQARAAHHLASADPERDGKITGPAHEEKYGLQRADASAAAWRGQGVHPTENRALVPGEPGAENLRGQVVDDDTAGGTDAVDGPDDAGQA